MHRVVIVDDHAAYRASASALLEADGFIVVGEAADGAGAVELVARVRPDVVVLDVQLPGLDGFDVSEQVAAMDEPPRIVLISSRDLTAYGRSALPSCVCGFVPKDELSGSAIAALIV